VVLASGAGTGFEAIAEEARRGELRAELLAVVTDQPEAGVIAKARARGIPVHIVPVPAKGEAATVEERRELHERRILEVLRPLKPRFLVLAGYMRVLSPNVLLGAFRSESGQYHRLVNIHPSLLPAFSGVDGYGQAFRFGSKVSGVTVHLVDAGLDSGPICAQEAFPIDRCRSEEEVALLGQRIEHRLYPHTLSWVLPERFRLLEKNGRFRVCSI
jgi:phosphoribosylglycinamide formyltransferase-1